MAILQRHIQAQRLQQKADPQLLMTNRILQMSAMELRQSLAQELSENPALESLEEQACDGCVVPGPQCVSCPFNPAPFASYSATEREEYRTALLQQLADRDEEVDPLSLLESPQTLQDHLLTQFGTASDPDDLPIARYLIANIDDDGYLRCSAEEAARSLDVSPGAVERVIGLIQTFDPAGVGARTLQECLLIQARSLSPEADAPQHLEAILDRFWKELASAKLRPVARALRTSQEEVEHTVEWLRRNLSPYPGSLYRPRWEKDASRRSQSVRPDVIVSLDEAGELVLDLPNEDAPAVHVHPTYADLWRQMAERPEDFGPAERKHVRDYMLRAQMFLKSLQDRATILRRVSECILEEQERYFGSEREEDMVPMTQSQLASFLRVHESTVSRAIAEKYIQLPSGRVVPLSFFFDRALSHRKLIANVLASEDPASPYSDQEISDILRRQGIHIARRTVMKYREEMNILSSRRRAR